MHFKKNGFYGILGRVGAGKTTLLNSIIEEIPFCKGKLVKSGNVAFVEQEPIIFSLTVKDNILFGLPYNQEKFENVIECCCLQEDL